MHLLFYIRAIRSPGGRDRHPAQVGSAGVRAGRSRRHALTNSSRLSGFRTGETGAYGGEGGRMIAAISIGIIIIVAVIVAALAIIYFILKGAPR